MKKPKAAYVLAGLDFVFDKEGNPWFIEANTVPGAFDVFEVLYGHIKPIDALARFWQ